MNTFDLNDLNTVLELFTLIITGLYILQSAISSTGSYPTGSSIAYLRSPEQHSCEKGSFEDLRITIGCRGLNSMVRYLLPVTLVDRFEVGTLISVSKRSLKNGSIGSRPFNFGSRRQYLTTKIA